MARKLAIVVLIALILLLAIPLGIGMAVGVCPDCPVPGAPSALTICAVLTIVLALAFSPFATSVGFSKLWKPAFAFVDGLERPPRSF